MTAAKIPKGPSIFYFIRKAKILHDPSQILDVYKNLYKKYGGVCSFRSVLRERTYLVFSADLITEIFKNPKIFQKYPYYVPDIEKLQALMGKGLVASHSDQEWSEHRKAVTPFFKPHYVRDNYYSIINKHCLSVMHDFEKALDMIVNISEKALLFTAKVLSEILSPQHSINDADFLEIKSILNENILAFHKRSFKKNAELSKEKLLKIVERLFISSQKHSGNLNPGLISVMIDNFTGDCNSFEGYKKILEQVLNMIVAGYETTSATIAWAIYCLAQNENIQDELYDEINRFITGDFPKKEELDKMLLLNSVVDEVLRLYPAIWFTVRYSTQEISVQDCLFKNKSRVIIFPFIGNRENRKYDASFKFDPKRYLRGEPPSFFPFGHGPRHCIGKDLAEAELKFFVCAMVKKFKIYGKNTVKEFGGVLLKSSEDIFVRLKVRDSK